MQTDGQALQVINVYGLGTIDTSGKITLANTSRGKKAIYGSVGHAMAGCKRLGSGLRIIAFEVVGVVQEKKADENS